MAQEWKPKYIKEQEFSPLKENQRDAVNVDAKRTSEYIRTMKELRVGAGASSFRADDNGIWLGSEQFSSAPFRVTMAGALTATSVTITGMITTFKQDAVPTATAAGDIWFDTNDDNKCYVATAAGDDQITAGEWETVQDGTIATAQATADGKIVTFYQDEPPTATSIGDLWVDTNDGNKLYRATATGSGDWVEIQDDDIATAISDAGTAQSTADSKIITFYQSGVPTATDAGDLWVDTDDGKMYRSTNIGDDQITAGEWERVDVGLNPVLIDALSTTNAPAAAGADVTADNTAANITGQGTLATENTADFDTLVSGAEKPDNNATVGAVAGTNLTDSGATTLNDQDIKNTVSINAGETINGATLPVPVYVNNADGEVYACDADASDKFAFFGFAISNSTDGNPINVQVTGIVPGFSGLTVGAEYYVSATAGTITSTTPSLSITIGKAVSATEIVIIHRTIGKLITGSTTVLASDNAETVSEGSYTKYKEILITEAGTYNVYFELQNSTGGGTAHGRIYVNGVAVGTERGRSTSWFGYNENITFAVGDLLQLYLWSGGTGTNSARYFRVQIAGRAIGLVLS